MRAGGGIVCPADDACSQQVALHDCLLLEHVMWSRPEQAPTLRAWLLVRALPEVHDVDLDADLDAAYFEACRGLVEARTPLPC